MRKSRTVVKDIDAANYATIAADFQSVFSLLESLGVVVPAWATSMLVFTRSDKRYLDVSFFDDTKEFFLWYSRVLIDGADNLRFAAFSREQGKDWKAFVPPTLIGVELRTRLRSR